MTIAILNKLPYAKAPYDQWVHGTEGRFVLFTSSETYESYIDKGFVKIFSFDNYENNPEVEQMLIQSYKEFNFTCLIALSEFDIIRAGKLRSLLGISGQDYYSATAFRNKMLMKQIAEYGGIRVPQNRLINSRNTVADFIENYGLPAIIKPVDGSGSEGVIVLQSIKDLKIGSLNELTTKGAYEIESFIDGVMYHIDGIIENYMLRFCSISKYYKGCLEFQHNRPLSSYTISNSSYVYEKIYLIVEKLLNVMPTPRSTSFHAELIVDKENNIFLCEVASRTGGGKIGRVIELKYGISLNQFSFQIQCGNMVSYKLNTNNYLYGFILIPPQKGRFMGLSQTPDLPWIVEYDLTIPVNTTSSEASHSADYAVACIVKANSEQEIEKNIDYTANWFLENMKWEQY